MSDFLCLHEELVSGTVAPHMTTADLTADVKRLFDAGAHFAQVKSRRHPSTKSFVVGLAGRTEIIDLRETVLQLERAEAALETLARDGKTVVFVGGKPEVASLVRAAAERVHAPYVATRWLGGTITNWSEIQKRIDRLAILREETASGALAKQHTKLEVVRLTREMERLIERLDGIAELHKRPDALVVVDTKHEKHAVKEARLAGIPVIALMSSDCNLADATYPILANDSSRASVETVLDRLALALSRGTIA